MAEAIHCVEEAEDFAPVDRKIVDKVSKQITELGRADGKMVDNLVENQNFFTEEDLATLQQINTADLLPLGPEDHTLSDIDAVVREEIFNEQTVKNELPEHFSKYPNLVKVDTESQFEITIKSGDEQSWLYDADQSKLFAKMNAPLNVTISYKPKTAYDSYFLRAMIVYSSPSEMHLNVKRCKNHRIETEKNKNVPMAHIIKSNHPNTIYWGDENKWIFGERLSLVANLGLPKVNECGICVESVGFEFLCQNSCSSGINRKSTALVFTLEDASCNILGKEHLNFKVCSCPKRDMNNEKNPNRKRASTTNPHGKYPIKVMRMPEVKQEPQTPRSTSPELVEFSIVLPSIESAIHVARCAYNEVTGKMAKSKNPEKYLKYARDIEAYQQLLEKSNV